MSSFFLNLSAFWWAFLIPLIVLLYFLKLKRDEKIFPSTILWRRTIEDLRVNSPFQKLKNNLLLVLQILLLLLLILALARPFLVKRNALTSNVVILLDNSASMQALDENGISRIEKAKELAIKMIDDLSEGDRMMVISFSGTSTIRQPFTGLKSLLKQSIQNIQSVDRETRLLEALAIANAMCQKVSKPSIYVMTDGAIPGLDDVLQKYAASQTSAKKESVQTVIPRFLLVGKHADNVAIVALEVRADQKQYYQTFVRVQNFGGKAVQGLLQLYINGEPLEEDIRMVELGSGDIAGVLFQGLKMSGGIIEARLTVTKGDDYLSVDNKAFFSLTPSKRPKLCLVTEGNQFLVKVLKTYDADFTTMSIETFDTHVEKTAKVLQGFDMIVVDNYSPAKPLPPCGYLFFNGVPLFSGVQSRQEIVSTQDNPLYVIDQNEFHPVMRFVNMRKLYLAKAMQIEWPQESISLLEAKNHTVAAAFSSPKAQYVVVGFDIFQTDWPLRLSFPIFIANAIQYFINSQSVLNVRTGESFHFRIPEDVSSGEIIIPSGERFPFVPPNDLFSNTDHTGLYNIVFPKRPSVSVAVNLFSIEESDITPKNKVQMGKENIGSRDIQPINREIWWTLAVMAFFILLLEWYVFHRRSLPFWHKKA